MSKGINTMLLIFAMYIFTMVKVIEDIYTPIQVSYISEEVTVAEVVPSDIEEEVEVVAVVSTLTNREIVSHILELEGSTYINNDVEESKWGVTKSVLLAYNKKNNKAFDVKTLTKAEATDVALYLMETWGANKIESPEVRAVVFDAMYNTGRNRAIRIAQKAAGVTADGSLTNMVDAINRMVDTTKLVKDISNQRLDIYKSFKLWNRYATGWTKRIRSIEKFALNV